MKAKAELQRLKAANLERATPAVFNATIKDDAPDRAEAEVLLKTIADYLSQFVPPKSECICCGSRLCGKDMVDAFLSGASFTWGLAHGEGHCRECGYPARAHHRIGEILTVNNFILQYHPDTLE